MSEQLEQEFEKADLVLSDALIAFQDQGVSQYVYGMALLEIGIAALVKLEESDDTILQVTREFIAKAKGFQESVFPVPREQLGWKRLHSSFVTRYSAVEFIYVGKTMAGSVNKVILVGNLGRDPEIRFAQSGQKIANMSIATSEQWRDKQSGERKEKTEWHRVVVFDEKLAEIVEKYVKKGSKVYLEGSLQTRKWTGNDGIEKYTTEVVLQRFSGVLTMLDSPGGSGGAGYSGGGGGYSGGDEAPSWDGPDSGSSSGGGKPGGDLDDEIPF